MNTAQAPVQDDQLIQPLCAIFRRCLKRKGLKFTPERARILDFVLTKPGVFEADQLLYEMRQAGHRASKATIYRTLKHLLEADIVSEVLLDANQRHYQLSFGLAQRSHMVCVQSNKIIEFTLPELAQIRDRICREHGFVPAGYRFVVYGISPEAQQNKAKQPD